MQFCKATLAIDRSVFWSLDIFHHILVLNLHATSHLTNNFLYPCFKVLVTICSSKTFSTFLSSATFHFQVGKSKFSIRASIWDYAEETAWNATTLFFTGVRSYTYTIPQSNSCRLYQMLMKAIIDRNIWAFTYTTIGLIGVRIYKTKMS